MKTRIWTKIVTARMLAGLLGAGLPGAGLLGAALPARAAQSRITKVVLSKGFKTAKAGPGTPINVTTTFKPGDRTIHCSFQLDRLTSTPGTARAVWTAVKATGLSANTKFQDQKMGPLAHMAGGHFHISNNQDWPVGQYKVDIYLNGKYVRTLNYSVK